MVDKVSAYVCGCVVGRESSETGRRERGRSHGEGGREQGALGHQMAGTRGTDYSFQAWGRLSGSVG